MKSNYTVVHNSQSSKNDQPCEVTIRLSNVDTAYSLAALLGDSLHACRGGGDWELNGKTIGHDVSGDVTLTVGKVPADSRDQTAPSIRYSRAQRHTLDLVDGEVSFNAIALAGGNDTDVVESVEVLYLTCRPSNASGQLGIQAIWVHEVKIKGSAEPVAMEPSKLCKVVEETGACHLALDWVTVPYRNSADGPIELLHMLPVAVEVGIILKNTNLR